MFFIILNELYIFRNWRRHESLKKLSTSLLLINLSFASLVASVIAVSSILTFGLNIDRFVFYIIGAALYFSLWTSGHRRFLKDTIRLPRRKREMFNALSKIFNIFVIVLLTAAAGVTGIYEPLRNYLFFGYPTDVPSRFLFFLLAPFMLIAFLYFNHRMGVERRNNASKLVQARIQLMQYAIYLQGMIALTTVTATALLLGSSLPEFNVIAVMLVLNTLSSTLSSVIIRQSIHIPNWIRRRFDLAPARYQTIQNS